MVVFVGRGHGSEMLGRDAQNVPDRPITVIRAGQGLNLQGRSGA